MNIAKRRAVEGLEGILFWLNILKRFDKFNEKQRERIDKAYRLTNEVYQEFRLELKNIRKKESD